MKSTHSRILFSTAAALGLATAAVHATSLGINTDPGGSLWDRGNPSTGFATWDTFSSATFTGAAPGSFFGITTPTLSQPNTIGDGAGGGTYNNIATFAPGNDIFFGGGENVSFTAAGTVSFTIRGVVLQLKRPNNQGGLNDANGFLPTLTINGVTKAFDSAVVTSGNGDTNGAAAGNYSVTSYYWGPSLAAITEGATNTFSVNIANSASQRALDGIVVDLGPASVPEPSISVTLLGGLGLLAGRRRFRQLA